MTAHPEELFNEIGRQVGFVRTEHRGRPAFKIPLWDVSQSEYETDEAGVEQYVNDLFIKWDEWWPTGGERFDGVELELEVVGWETGELMVVLINPSCPECGSYNAQSTGGAEPQAICGECGTVWEVS